MKADLMFIDARGQLYRGYGREWPILVWLPDQARWAACDIPTPQHWDWGQLVTKREAERCYPGCMAAPLPEGIQATIEATGDDMMRYRPEVFDFYDFGTMPRKSPEEEAERNAEIKRSLPEETRAMLAKLRAEREAEKVPMQAECDPQQP
jgi:hypothetical protein